MCSRCTFLRADACESLGYMKRRAKSAPGRFRICAGIVSLNHRQVIVACHEGKLSGRHAKRARGDWFCGREYRLFCRVPGVIDNGRDDFLSGLQREP